METTEKKSYERSYLCEKIIEECYDSIVVTDAEGRYIIANKATEECMGLSKEEILGKRPGDMMAQHIYTNSTILESMRTKKTVTGLVNVRGVNRLSTSLPFLDENGNVEFIMTNNRSNIIMDEFARQLAYEHLDSQMYELAYVNIPLYNTSTFVSASDDQKAQMLQLAQAAAASCSETQDGSVSEQVSALHSAASAALPDIYAVLDSTPAEDASNVQTELLTESDLTGSFTQDGAADAVRGLVYGEAAAVQYNAASIILMMRIDPLQVSTLDALRTQILSDMKGDELEDALTAYGSTLENDLSTSAMNKMPASKIVNPSSSSNS